MTKTWFITGTSRGFGYEWTKAALKRGDKVAATARNTDSLKELIAEYGDSILPIQLDVTNKSDDFAAIKKAFDHFGTIDVIVNNAGYGAFGMIEELTEEEIRAQLETNFFGAVWVTQAALPYLRKQGHGHILQVSSIGGQVAFAGIGYYNASKWALEAFSEALAQEVGPLGINVTIIEPGGFSTDWAGDSAAHAKNQIPDYDSVRDARIAARGNNKVGDPVASSEAILKVVDAETPPLRLLLGKSAVDIIKRIYPSRLETWAEWETVSIAADGQTEA